jgi:hypothetical protein
VVAPVLCLGLGSSPVLASNVVVPDDLPTVQSAIDSGADTVLIRDGTYSERPVIDRAVVLLSAGVGRPRLAGLQVYNSYFASPWELRVSRVDFTGRVAYQTLYVHPRVLTLSFLECALDSGLQIINLDSEDISTLWLYRCRMAAESHGQVDRLFMVAGQSLYAVYVNTQGAGPA